MSRKNIDKSSRIYKKKGLDTLSFLGALALSPRPDGLLSVRVASFQSSFHQSRPLHLSSSEIYTRKLDMEAESECWQCYTRKRWVTHANALTRCLLKQCTYCQRKFGSPLSQQMADLPVDRVSPNLPPFTNTGIDFFGPIPVKQGCGTVKRYGALFTCLVIRAVHIEMSVSLNTDAFINTLRRFIAQRGQVKAIHSDNGTNFVGADRKLQRAMSQWNSAQISSFLLQTNIVWCFNVPAASHHGGSWEWLIRSTQRGLSGIPLTTGRGTSAETCGLDDVFPPDDLSSHPKTLC